MAQRKRTSKRRWKARCRIGRPIPALMIAMHELDRWFAFEPVNANLDVWIAQHG